MAETKKMTVKPRKGGSKVVAPGGQAHQTSPAKKKTEQSKSEG